MLAYFSSLDYEVVLCAMYSTKVASSLEISAFQYIISRSFRTCCSGSAVFILNAHFLKDEICFHFTHTTRLPQESLVYTFSFPSCNLSFLLLLLEVQKLNLSHMVRVCILLFSLPQELLLFSIDKYVQRTLFFLSASLTR